MNSISSALGSPVQSALKVGTTAHGTTAAAPQEDATHGDTVTISEEAKAQASNASDRKKSGSVAAFKLTAGNALSAKILAQNLQDAKVQQKSLKAKLEVAKQQEQSNPGESDEVAKLNAKLNDINAKVSKDQAKIYSQ